MDAAAHDVAVPDHVAFVIDREALQIDPGCQFGELHGGQVGHSLSPGPIFGAAMIVLAARASVKGEVA